jgi:hypothetical protein
MRFSSACKYDVVPSTLRREAEGSAQRSSVSHARAFAGKEIIADFEHNTPLLLKLR